MQWPLVLAGLALGAASVPHCALMCAAPCAALTHGGARPAAGFQAGRLVGYVAGGALAAASVSALGGWVAGVPALRPLWTLLHLGFLALGLYWLATGRQGALLRRDGALPVPVPVRFAAQRRRRSLRATLAGLAWVAWPCAALQGALLLAALANDAAGGALVMAAFALASMPGLVAAPWAYARWRAWRGGAVSSQRASALAFRIAGGGLALVSAGALGHGLWERVADWCAF